MRQRAGVLAPAVLIAMLAWQASTRSVDFPIYHRIASQILAGDYELYPAEVYSGETIPPHGFRYLPVIAFLFVPFAWLPLPFAALTFFILKLAALAWVGVTVARHAGLGRDWTMPVTALLAVAGYAAEELRYGNAHALVVALMVLAYDRARRGAIVSPAVALALAIATKITPLALLGYFAWRRRVAVSVGTVTVLGVLLVLPAVVVGWETNARLLTGFSRYAVQKVDELDNYSWRGVIDRRASAGPVAPIDVRSDEAARWLWWAGLVLVAAATLLSLRRPPPDDLTALLELSIIFVVMLIVSPHTQRRYFVQLLVPALALLGVIRASGSAPRTSAYVGLAAIVVPGTVLPLVFGGRRLALAYESTAPYFWGIVVLLVVLVRAAAKMKASAPRVVGSA